MPTTNYQIQNYPGQEIETLLGKIANLGLATTSNPGTMSAEDKTKLNGIAEGAQENVIESVKIDGVALTPSSKAVNIETDAAPTKDSEKLIKSKAVYSAMAKYGVISQTQTWIDFTRYTMTERVFGPIPKANIDIFEAAGAVFNEDTGYFELNGLLDISYSEMQAIYQLPKTTFVQNGMQRLYLGINGRTNLCLVSNTGYQSMDSGNIVSMCLNDQYLEAFAFCKKSNGDAGDVSITSGMSFAFYNCRRLKRIIGIVYLSARAGNQALNNAFDSCIALEEIRLRRVATNISFADSPNLSKDSLLYMINNETATSPIVITLHSSVYAKCQGGGDWYSDVEAALDEHTNVSLATA